MNFKSHIALQGFQRDPSINTVMCSKDQITWIKDLLV